ncbi:MAG TPA: tetratricopeptide repeat protein [Drouetiella sp.]
MRSIRIMVSLEVAMPESQHKLEFFVQCSLNAVNLLVLAYLVVYARACPSAALVSAVLFEIAFYVCLLTYRFWRSRQPKSADQAAIVSLSEEWKLFGRVRTAKLWTTLCASLMVALYLTVDLGALLSANSGHLNTALKVYEVIAPPASQALHPAFSLELLAGAYVESKQFQKAEPLELGLFELRKDLAGENSELVAAMLANLGDMYAKENRNAEAENYYLRAIAMTDKLHLPQGYGSPMTKLGILYSNEKRYEEAQRAFDSARAIRARIFGANSEKVGETLQANLDMLIAQDRLNEANELRLQIARTKPSEPKFAILDTAVPVGISAASLIVFWKRDRLLLYAANFVRNHLSK